MIELKVFWHFVHDKIIYGTEKFHFQLNRMNGSKFPTPQRLIEGVQYMLYIIVHMFYGSAINCSTLAYVMYDNDVIIGVF